MQFYHIRDDYVGFLLKFDRNVADNKQGSRPYIGVVLDIGGIDYYAPFTSPKPKHQKMKNQIDFRKIGGGLYGAINFNNMIPVPQSALVRMDIEAEHDLKYKNLLRKQYKAILRDREGIVKTAHQLREMLLKDDSELREFEKEIKKRSCNLRILEKVYKDYER